jgi:hypothetical protein
VTSIYVLYRHLPEKEKHDLRCIVPGWAQNCNRYFKIARSKIWRKEIYKSLLDMTCEVSSISCYSLPQPPYSGHSKQRIDSGRYHPKNAEPIWHKG